MRTLIYLTFKRTTNNKTVMMRKSCNMKQLLLKINRQRPDFMCFPLFAIKNRYKITLHKYTREMQHVVNPFPPPQSKSLQWSHKHLGGQNYTKKRFIYVHTNNTITTTALLQGKPVGHSGPELFTLQTPVR